MNWISNSDHFSWQNHLIIWFQHINDGKQKDKKKKEKKSVFLEECIGKVRWTYVNIAQICSKIVSGTVEYLFFYALHSSHSTPSAPHLSFFLSLS